MKQIKIKKTYTTKNYGKFKVIKSLGQSKYEIIFEGFSNTQIVMS
jgi:hypothetical protein